MPNSSSFRTTSPTLNPRRAARSPTATGPLRVISVGSTTVGSAGASTLRSARRVRRSAWNRRGGGGGGRRRSGRLGASGGLAGRGAETGGGAWRSVGSKIWGDSFRAPGPPGGPPPAAPPGGLARRIEPHLADRRAHDAHHFPLRPHLAAGHAHTLRHPAFSRHASRSGGRQPAAAPPQLVPPRALRPSLPAGGR